MNDDHDPVLDAHLIVDRSTKAVLDAYHPREMTPHLRRLRDVLPAHFADEEAPGGYFDRIRRLHRRGDAHVEQLIAQHRAMLPAVERLAACDGDWPDGFGAEAKAVARQLREHERTESRLGVVGDTWTPVAPRRR